MRQSKINWSTTTINQLICQRKSAKCKTNQKLNSKIAAAKNAGLSYGEYVARYGNGNNQ
ncbi:MAG: hypothetical protein RSC44_04445 [Clostridia bacterium]